MKPIMGLNATCCASCCAPPSDSSAGSRTPPNRSPVRTVRFISPVASAFGRVRKDMKEMSSNSNVAVNPGIDGYDQCTDMPPLGRGHLDTNQMTIPTEFEASPSPEVYRGKLPWSCQQVESTVSTPASEYDAAPAPEVHFDPHVTWRTSAPWARRKASPCNDADAFELPDTPTRQKDRRSTRNYSYSARSDVGNQRQGQRSRAGEHCLSPRHIRSTDAVTSPRGMVIGNGASTQRTSTHSHSKSKDSKNQDRRAGQACELIDLPMRLAHSLQYRKPRNTSESSSTTTDKTDDSDFPIPRVRWRSSGMKTGASRPASVSQSQFGRYHVFTILVEKDDVDSLP